MGFYPGLWACRDPTGGALDVVAPPLPRKKTKIATRNRDHAISAASGCHSATGIDYRNTAVPASGRQAPG